MKEEPALELALLERVETISRSDGEDVVATEDEVTFEALREMMREGLVEAKESNSDPDEVQSVFITGLTTQGRRRLRALREAGVRPW